MNYKFFVSLLVLIVGCSNYAYANDYEVAICDSCTTTNHFRNAALATGHTYKDVVVVNTYQKSARAFSITKPFNTSDFIEYIKPINLPAGTLDAIEKYHELQRQFIKAYDWINKFGGDGQSGSMQKNTGESSSKYLNESNFIEHIKGNAALQDQNSCASNGCGSPGHWSFPLIPNSPFLASCNQHDVCYCSGQSKGFCDQQFLHNMKITITNIMLSLNGGLYHPAKKVEGVLLAKALYAQADLYYNTVNTSAAAKHAYCQASGNTNAVECRSAPSDQVQDRYSGTSSGSYIFNGREIIYRCTTFDVYTKQTGEYSGSYTICSFA